MSNCAPGDTLMAKGDKFSLHQCPKMNLRRRIWRVSLCLGSRKSHVCTSLYASGYVHCWNVRSSHLEIMGYSDSDLLDVLTVGDPLQATSSCWLEEQFHGKV
ncbi:hypothetical protein CK203_100804 [Vitis vinifera]|uniref:Uncharacterized protein n=1 Tax=Vitis vinifera TaxID=29760 RepID=A0A438CKH7_VITVI|nr:hypothetical protein CK203_100804 [Vitis vinifera]